jgi:hypothetical protein
MTESLRHVNETDLVLHVYSDSGRTEAIDRHLQQCPGCAASFQAIAAVLAAVPDIDVPPRGDLYGLEVWQRIRPILPARRAWWNVQFDRRHAFAALSVAAALTLAFLAGQHMPVSTSTPPPVAAASDAAAGRARLAATADHLEQSERVLLDLTNADGPADVSRQQAWAADLIDANRLYRDAAVQANDAGVATLLDDLERSLLDIVHAPSTLTPAQLDDVRTRLDAAALVFKVRILSNELRDREAMPIAPKATT